MHRITNPLSTGYPHSGLLFIHIFCTNCLQIKGCPGMGYASTQTGKKQAIQSACLQIKGTATL
ncbi:hypothetical protein C7N43_21230 [Sphingobacteriales bacterium UPWRP_1]|nr:hypothetical protein C7N43_21230 [Sphingobacteriales bacterium UPWRP_1]